MHERESYGGQEERTHGLIQQSILVATLCLMTMVLLWNLTSCVHTRLQETGEPIATLGATEGDPVPTESKEGTAGRSEAQYGALQKIAEEYGFPIHLRMPEGMDLTEVLLYADHAEYEWMTLNRQKKHEKLSWSITGNVLTVTGDWEGEFTVDAEKGRATLMADGKEYRIVTYDKDGEVAFHVP